MNTKEKKILFYSPSLIRDENNQKTLFLPTVPLFLNSYLKIFHHDIWNKISWGKLQFLELSQTELIKHINDLDIDILCISLYIWNSDKVLSQIQGIKEQVKKPLVIIAGGPSVEIVRNKNFLNENPAIDYLVYGQGESAFANILKNIFEIKKLSLLSTKNVAWRENNKTKISDFEFLRLQNLSPYLNSQELIHSIVNDSTYKNLNFILPYESSKGCPYKCTFCDWTSGLSHKSYYRKFNIEEELEFLATNGLTHFHMSDANFGQIEQDLDIVNTMVHLKKTKGYDFQISGSNFSKLQKDRVFKIADILLENKIVHGLKFAVQDIHSDVLENIDRPDIPWTEHKKYINDLHNKHKDTYFTIELIQGLPGQTRESWEKTLIDTDPYAVRIYPWILLPNSPVGYDNEYREKMKIKTCSMQKKTLIKNKDSVFTADTVVETFSYNLIDYAYFTLLSEMCTTHMFKFVNSTRKNLIEQVKRSGNLNYCLKNLAQALIKSDFILQDRIISKFIEEEFFNDINTLKKDQDVNYYAISCK